MIVGVLFLSLSSADVVSSLQSLLSPDSECAGSLTLHEGEHWANFTDGILYGSVKVDKAVLVGCGDCFRLFEKKNGRGRSYFVNRSGEHTIPHRKVRSIHKVPCSNMAMPMWVVIIMVLVIVMVVGVGSVVGVKKYRSYRYDNVNTEQV